MNRRNLLAAAPAVLIVTGAAASPAAAVVPSPILGAARQIAALNLQHEQADVPCADGRTLDAIWEQIWAQERFILDGTPATVSEAMVILMVAAGNLDTAGNCEAAHAMATSALSATARATRYLAGTTGVDVAEFGGDLYLPAAAAPSCMGRAV